MTQQCARTCNRCSWPAPVVAPVQPPSQPTSQRKAQGVLKLSEICLKATEAMLHGLELFLKGSLKYVHEARMSTQEAAEALRDASASRTPQQPRTGGGYGYTYGGPHYGGPEF